MHVPRVCCVTAYTYTHMRIAYAYAWHMHGACARSIEPPIFQARVPERVACCTLCSKLWSQTIIPPDEAHPVYCSERCKRKHMPEHRSWHRAFATKLEHKQELLHAQSSETREKMLIDVTDDYDLENVAALELLDGGDVKEAVSSK